MFQGVEGLLASISPLEGAKGDFTFLPNIGFAQHFLQGFSNLNIFVNKVAEPASHAKKGSYRGGISGHTANLRQF